MLVKQPCCTCWRMIVWRSMYQPCIQVCCFLMYIYLKMFFYIFIHLNSCWIWWFENLSVVSSALHYNCAMLNEQFKLTEGSGREIFFFSDSHSAPKFFKVVANSKKSWSPFSETNKTLCYTVSILERPSKIKVGKRSLVCFKVDTRMDDIQCSSSPKSKMASSYRLRCTYCILETNLTRKFAADLSLQIFLIHYISW